MHIEGQSGILRGTLIKRPPGFSLLRWLRQNVAATFLFLVLLAGWQAAVVILGIREYLLPDPGSVARAVLDASLRWPDHILITGLEIGGGFLVAATAGIVLGILIAWSPLLEKALLPFLVFVNTLPKVAVAPLVLVWVGYGLLPNIIIAAVIAFFPVAINTAVGLTQIDPDLIDLGRSLGAPKWRVFLKIRLPNALPYLLSGLKVSSTLAVVGAIIGEFIASQRGLGAVIITTQVTLNTTVAFASLVWISILGIVLYAVVDLVSRWVTPWAQEAMKEVI